MKGQDETGKPDEKIEKNIHLTVRVASASEATILFSKVMPLARQFRENKNPLGDLVASPGYALQPAIAAATFSLAKRYRTAPDAK